MTKASESIRTDGRWGGALTSRPLPDDDSIAQLNIEERSLVARSWLGRAAAERRAADAFVVIRDALIESQTSGDLVPLAERAIDDEIRHAELCRVVAERYEGRPVVYEHLELKVPKPKTDDAQVRRTLLVISQCVLNETTASAFLEACLDAAKGELARAALRELLSDEIDHARIGWAHLASSSEAHKKNVEGHLLSMLRANVAEWRKPSAPIVAGPVAARLIDHGMPTPTLVEESILAAVVDLILPGFERVGVRVPGAKEWVAAGCT